MSKKTGKKVDFKAIVWCIDNLSTEQLKVHDKKPFKEIEIIPKISEMIEDGFKVSCKWDSYNNCFLATAICDHTSYDNGGLAISSRGQDAQDVLSILLFKYYTVAERNLKPFADKIPTGVRG